MTIFHKIKQRFYDASIFRKQILVFGLVLLVLAANLFFLYSAVSTMSAIRAYVGGEGIWSRYQKDAVYSLRKYAIEKNEGDYNKFIELLRVPLGDKKARLELEKDNTDFQIVYEGFTEGGNHPEDLRDMARLFKTFRNIKYIDRAISAWEEADGLISELIVLGQDIHNDVIGGRMSQDNALIYLAKVDSINHELTILESNFSKSLGEASRFARDFVFISVFTIFIIFGISILILIFKVSRFISHNVIAIKNLAVEIAKGNLEAKLQINSKDEFGELAASLNKMSGKIADTRAELAAKNAELSAQFASAEENNRYLEKIKTATLNLLEDLDSAKSGLEAAKLKDEAILSSIGDGMIVIDENENIILVNQRAEDMLGYNAEEFLGRKWHEALVLKTEAGAPVPLQDRPVKQAFLTQKRASALPLITPSKTYYFTRKDGSRFPVEIIASPIILEGKSLGVVEVFRDITQEKEIERVKTEFVSIASHQLRTPLSTINWYSEILLSGDAGDLTSYQKEYLNEIYKGNKRMIDLVNALLNVSRLEVGAFIVETKEMNLSEVVKEVLNELKPQIQAKNIVVEENYDKAMPPVYADFSLVKVILQNLITNSIKYTPQGGKVQIEIAPKANKTFIITVGDTGIGIPKEQQPKIFTKLFRADNARETDPDGTGLGLYIIKSIIDQTSGKIWFESEEGKGTRFYISAPTEWMRPKAGTRKLI